MKNTIKNKKGISLIVLVITIIVMIILAAAIILSISNSGVIDKANKAKADSDAANLKEYVNVLEAEWELMTEAERGLSGYASKVAYVNGELTKKEYSAAYSTEGEIYTTANDIAKDALSKGLKIGDEVKYTVTVNKYTPDEDKTGTSDNTELTAQTNLKWIYVGVSEEGELLITPDVSSGVPANSSVTLYGKQGWLTGPEELNTICDKLYTVSGKGTARSMNIDDVTRILGYTGEKGSYITGSNDYVPTTEAKKIGDIEEELNTTLSSRETPESGKNLEDYYSDYYYIYKTNDVKEMKNSKYVNLIYPSSGYYWLASSGAHAYFYYGEGAFLVSLVEPSKVRGAALFGPSAGEHDASLAIRPVVSLTSKIQTGSTSGSGVWEFVK